MKYPILALTLLATAPLAADNNYYSNDSCCEQTCCPPKKCIDCECYTPQYYDLQCDWGLFVSGEFLYWYARETNLDYAAVADNQVSLGNLDINASGTGFVFFPSSIESFGVNWDPGFRVGIGYNWRCDGWDTYVNWTSFCTSRSDSVSVTSTQEGRIINQWTLAPSYFLDTNPPFTGEKIATAYPWTSVSGKWSLRYNQVDLELGRKYWLSRCFTLRPYAGIRGQWIKTTFKTTSIVDAIRIEERAPTVAETLATEDITDNLTITDEASGWGLLVGIQPNWHFCSNFILYSNFSGSLTWGKYESKHDEFVGTVINQSGTVTDAFRIQFENDFYGMLATLDLGIGLRWEETWCCDRYRTRLDLGWEHHILFDYNHRTQFDPLLVAYAQVPGSALDSAALAFEQDDVLHSPSNGFTRTDGTLAMGGFVLRARFDF